MPLTREECMAIAAAIRAARDLKKPEGDQAIEDHLMYRFEISKLKTREDDNAVDHS